MEFSKFGFEAEIGNSIKTGKIILESLKSENWLDNETAVIFIEQTYFNQHLSYVRKGTKDFFPNPIFLSIFNKISFGTKISSFTNFFLIPIPKYKPISNKF